MARHWRQQDASRPDGQLGLEVYRIVLLGPGLVEEHHSGIIEVKRYSHTRVAQQSFPESHAPTTSVNTDNNKHPFGYGKAEDAFKQGAARLTRRDQLTADANNWKA